MRNDQQVRRHPHAGDLRHRIKITESADTISENGFQETATREVATVWAAIVDGSGNPEITADAETFEYTTAIVIRYRGDIRPGMRATYTKTNQTWRIVAVDAYQYDRHFLSLKCQRIEEAEA